MRCTFSRPEEADALLEAIRVDTPGFVHLSRDGPSIEIRLAARSAASARATCEDLFACLKVAERTILAARPAETGRPPGAAGG